MTLRNLLRRGQASVKSPFTWLTIVAVVLLVLVARSAGKTEAVAFDPNSTEANGTKAAVLTLQKLGVTVSATPKVEGDTIVLFDDLLTRQQDEDLSEWVRTGGTLILGDSASPLAQARVSDSGAPRSKNPKAQCSSPWVRGINSLDLGDLRSYPALTLPDGATGCFPAFTGGYVTAEYSEGLGTIVQVGTPQLFTNEYLGKGDNAVLLANLVGASKGASVTVLQPDTAVAPDGGDGTLLDLVPGALKAALVQLVIALVFFALWRGRRLGRVVHEVQPVALPASALVLAVGELLQQAGQTNSAAFILRHDLRRRLAELVGVSSDLAPGVLAQMIAQRTGIDEGRMLQALVDAPVGNGEQLLALAQTIEEVHREVAHAR